MSSAVVRFLLPISMKDIGEKFIFLTLDGAKADCGVRFNHDLVP